MTWSAFVDVISTVIGEIVHLSTIDAGHFDFERIVDAIGLSNRNVLTSLVWALSAFTAGVVRTTKPDERFFDFFSDLFIWFDLKNFIDKLVTFVVIILKRFIAMVTANEAMFMFAPSFMDVLGLPIVRTAI